MARRRALAASGWLPLFGIWLLACSVDHRHLRLGADEGSAVAGADTTASAGDPATGGAGPVTNRASDEGGAAGASSEPGPTGGSATAPPLAPLVNGCADLDTDMVADCTVTLVKNPSFKSDVADWTAVKPATLAWDSRNALSDTPSGCALLTAQGATDIDGSTPFSASQCVAVPPNAIIIAWATALIGPDAGATGTAQAEIVVSFFDAADCAGPPTAAFSTPPSSANTWAIIQAGGLSGPATSSASVALVGLKPNRADALSVCFDNVMVKAKTP